MRRPKGQVRADRTIVSSRVLRKESGMAPGELTSGAFVMFASIVDKCPQELCLG